MLRLKTTPENEADTIRTLAGPEGRDLSDEIINSIAVLGEATDYVFDKVTENVDIFALSANLRAGDPADYSDYDSIRDTDVNDFIVQALTVKQEQAFRTAVLYYAAGVAVSFLPGEVTAESANDITMQQYSEKKWKDKEMGLYARANRTIRRIINMYPDDAYSKTSYTTVRFV